MPELISSYRHAWWLPGPHLPSIWGKKVRKQPFAHDRIERWTTPDGDHLSIARAGTITPGRPHLLVLHGLEGTIRSNYIHGLMSQAVRRGWSADLMMFRGCDGEINNQRRMYHSGETIDLDFVVRTLVEHHPEIDIRPVGVSLGGNVLMKWLGEQGETLVPNIARAAGVSVPYDLGAGSRFLENFMGQLYVDHFMKTLKSKTLAKQGLHPDLCDWEKMAKARTFWEFDDVVTGPIHGFAGADDYYTRSSSIHFIGKIRRPTLLFGALDDPFVPPSVLELARKIARDNDFLHIEFSRQGGHVGWTSGHPWAPRYYMEERVIDWLNNE
jgi:predicted alpha/beta-fold hydrolase